MQTSIQLILFQVKLKTVFLMVVHARPRGGIIRALAVNFLVMYSLGN
jgi:hypothetical protein